MLHRSVTLGALPTGTRVAHPEEGWEAPDEGQRPRLLTCSPSHRENAFAGSAKGCSPVQINP